MSIRSKQLKKFNLKACVKFIFHKRYDKYLLYTIPLLLVCIFLLLSIYDASLRLKIEKLHVIQGKPLHVSDYPSLTNTNVPGISAYSAIIMDDASKKILYQKNANFRFSMASTTKVMTALAGLDYFNPQSILTIRRARVEGTVVGFSPGQKYYYSDILYGMLLPSGNDAAFSVADNYPGGVDKFVQKMNEKAASLHLKDTHYADPAGLDDDNDYTTVIDLARLTSAALSNVTIAKVVDTKERAFSSINTSASFTVENLNRLLDLPGITGVKTGHTEGAGDVLITSRRENGHTLIIVVMNSLDRFADTEVLLQFLNENIVYKTL